MAAIASLPETALSLQSGDRVVQLGWLHQRPQEANSAPRNRLRRSPLFPVLGIEESFRSESVDIRAQNLNTLGLAFKYFLSDNWSIGINGGVPRQAGLYASGEVGPTGPTRELIHLDIGRDEFNPVAKARQWSPVITLEFFFGEAEDWLRPSIAFGASYTFFTGEELDHQLETQINRRFGAPLALAAGRPGPTEVNSKAEPDIAPAFAIGLTGELTSRWSVAATLFYLELETTQKVTVEAADGTRLVTSKTKLQLDPLTFGLLVGYRF